MPTIPELLSLALRHHQAGELSQAGELYGRILKQDPNHADALHLLGMVAHQVGQQDMALKLLRKALALDGSNPVYLGNLGAVLQAKGDLAAAEACHRRALEFQPDSADAHNNLGVALMEQGKRDEAEACYLHALRLKPDYAMAHNNLANVYKARNRLDEAEAHYRQALRSQPNFVLALNNLGNVLKESNRLDEALECYRQALRLQPGFAEGHNNMGTVLWRQGHLTEAEACYRQAIQLKPDFAEARNNLGIVLVEQGKTEEALAYYQEAIALRKNYGLAQNNLGLGLMEQGKLDEAVDYFRQSVQGENDSAEAHNNLGNILMKQGKLEEALESYRKAMRLRPGFATVHSNLLFALNYDPTVDPEKIFAEHCRWGQLHGQPTGEDGKKGRKGEGEKGRKGNGEPGASATGEALGTQHSAPSTRHSSGLLPPASSLQPVLRIGYVSPDFRAHPVAQFFLPILAHHDPARFETFCYSDVRAPDAVTAQLQALAHQWRPIGGLTDEQAAEQIRADGIDILVDLAGHTAYHRLKVFALKPAPVQVTYLGYPNTTGLTQIDYRLGDAVLDPPEEPARYTEELVRLPGGFFRMTPPTDAPEVSPLPALRTGRITFGSLHNLAKMNAAVFDLWGRVLEAIPSSRLLVFRNTLRGETQELIRRQFAERGLAPDRLELRHDAGPQGFLGVYHDIDISFDVFPWTGHAVSCEALWMGVPVLTLKGNRPAGRLTASVLTTLGLTDWIARTPEEYVTLATQLAADVERLAQTRAGLRERMRTRLCAGEPFTRELENVYRTMWRRFVSGQ